MKKIAMLVLTLVLGFGFVGGFSGCEKEDTKAPIKTPAVDKKPEDKK